MSANIHYRQVKPIDGKDLAVGSPSSFIKCMERAFGTFPCTLSASNFPTLRGMAAMEGSGDNHFVKLIDAIEDLGEIEVYAEY